MTWFRSHRRCGGWLALLALAIQLALAFGHVHLDDTGPPTTVSAKTALGEPDHSQSPTGHKHDSDYCAICAVITLLNGAQTATASAMILPRQTVAADLPSTTDAAPAAPRPAAFRSRAPPIS